MRDGKIIQVNVNNEKTLKTEDEQADLNNEYSKLEKDSNLGNNKTFMEEFGGRMGSLSKYRSQDDLRAVGNEDLKLTLKNEQKTEVLNSQNKAIETSKKE